MPDVPRVVSYDHKFTVEVLSHKRPIMKTLEATSKSEVEIEDSGISSVSVRVNLDEPPESPLTLLPWFDEVLQSPRRTLQRRKSLIEPVKEIARDLKEWSLVKFAITFGAFIAFIDLLFDIRSVMILYDEFDSPAYWIIGLTILILSQRLMAQVMLLGPQLPSLSLPYLFLLFLPFGYTLGKLTKLIPKENCCTRFSILQVPGMTTFAALVPCISGKWTIPITGKSYTENVTYLSRNSRDFNSLKGFFRLYNVSEAEVARQWTKWAFSELHWLRFELLSLFITVLFPLYSLYFYWVICRTLWIMELDATGIEISLPYLEGIFEGIPQIILLLYVGLTHMSLPFYLYSSLGVSTLAVMFQMWRYWDNRTTMEGFRQVANHHGTIRCLFRSKYRSEFFSCGDDKKIIQWQVDSRTEPKVANYWNLDAIPFFGQVHDSGFFFRISKYQEKKGHMEIWRTDGHGDFNCWQRFASKGQTKVEFVILKSNYVLVTHGLATQLYTISGEYVRELSHELNKKPIVSYGQWIVGRDLRAKGRIVVLWVDLSDDPTDLLFVDDLAWGVHSVEVCGNDHAIVITGPQNLGYLQILHYSDGIEKGELVEKRRCQGVWEISVAPCLTRFLTLGMDGLLIWSFDSHRPVQCIKPPVYGISWTHGLFVNSDLVALTHKGNCYTVDISSYSRQDMQKMSRKLSAISGKDSSLEISEDETEILVEDDDVPSIRNLEWGTVSIETQGGRVSNFKDVLIAPGYVKKWDWNAHKPFTRHEPGVKVADIKQICTGATHLIIGCGMHCKLNVQKETCEFCVDQNIELLALPSVEASIEYAKLTQNGDNRVAFALHSTC